MRVSYANKNRFGKALMVAAAAVLLAAGNAMPVVQAQSSNVPELAIPDFTKVVEKVEGSVVNIRTTESVRVRRPGMRGNDPYELFRWFFGPDIMPRGFGMPEQDEGPAEQERTVPRGVGSGFIISDDGYIITNNHVIANSNAIFVTLTNGKEYKAEVIGTDERTDVALIKIDAKNLDSITIGDSNKLKKGEWVLAIGSPFGLDSTVTSGIVSAINRDTGDYLPFIQTDVAVNPGNSGGPLINLAGEVVGVNSQIVSRSGGFMGISLAIPIDEAMNVVNQLKEHGKVSRGRIGVQIGHVSDEVAEALGMESTIGALVSKVEPDGPAAKAGVRSGDVIVDFDGNEIKSMTDLPRLVGNTKPGSKASLVVWRKGKKVKLNVKVDEMPATNEDELPHSSSETSKSDSLGLTVRTIPSEQKQKLGIDGGVVVTSIQDPALSAGLIEGDIILMVNNHDISSAEQYNKVISGLSSGKPAALLVMRNNQSQWVTITPKK